MQEPFRPLQPGEPIDARSPVFSARRHNAINRLIDPARVGALPRPGGVVSTGRGTGGSALRRARIYTDLAGAKADSNGRINIPTVTCLYERAADGGGWEADTDGTPFQAEPVFGVARALDAEGCCKDGEGSGPVPAGLRLDHIAYIDDGAAVAITGRGVANNSAVSLAVTDGTTTKTLAATVAADGTFAATFDFTASTALTRGVLRYSGTETTIESVVQATRTLATVYDTAPVSGLAVPLEPPAPDLVAASDSGASSTDNLTDDATPTVTVTKAAGEVSQSATGPFPEVYADGAFSVGDTDTAALDSGSIDLTLTSLGNGLHAIQALLYEAGSGNRNSGYMSPPLYVTIDPDADGTEQPTDTRYCLRCLVDTSFAPPLIVSGDNCRQPMSAAEITAIDGA